jgi:hypothetical protein
VQAIKKLVHSEESKLSKATFTGCCFSLGNSKVATNKVKSQYQKALNSWTVYFEATLYTAWKTFTESHEVIMADLTERINSGNSSNFLSEFR